MAWREPWWTMAAVPGRSVDLRMLFLVLAAVSALGCGSTVPTATSSPAADPSAATSALPDLTPAPSPTPVPGTPSSPAEGGFRTLLVNADGGGRLPVELQDLTGLVVGIEPAGAEPPFDEGVSNPEGRPNVLRYRWTGGACDTLTSISFERVARGFRFVSTTKTTGGACILIGIGRGVDVHLSEAIDADSVVLGDR